VRQYPVYKKKITVGIIGCGTIGSLLADACQGALRNRIRLVGLHDSDNVKAQALSARLKRRVAVRSLKKLIQESDLIIEAASSKVSATIAEQALTAGKDIMVMSVGGLLAKSRKLFQKAEKKQCRMYIPSGAVCGIDGIKSAGIGTITSAVLTTRKPPRGLEGVPYLAERGIKVSAIKEDTVVFQGSAQEAVRRFPKNINVSAVVSLAGIGARRTRVKIIASPRAKRNTHEIELNGDFGTIYTRCENVPSKGNPKTSMLAALSAIATLKAITLPVHIGT
jgi:aspartate dehydrogenase